MTIDPDKYVVFKRADYEQSRSAGGQPAQELSDAVVIRKRDKLAAGALHSYATACWTTADVLTETGQQAKADELNTIGEYFMAQYEEAREMQDHLPTL